MIMRFVTTVSILNVCWCFPSVAIEEMYISMGICCNRYTELYASCKKMESIVCLLQSISLTILKHTIYPNNYAYELCYCVVLMDFTHILQSYFSGTGAVMWLPSVSEATLISRAKYLSVLHNKSLCIFHEKYCMLGSYDSWGLKWSCWLVITWNVSSVCIDFPPVSFEENISP